MVKQSNKGFKGPGSVPGQSKNVFCLAKTGGLQLRGRGTHQWNCPGFDPHIKEKREII